MSRELPFDPFPFLHGPHHQTIISSFFNLLFEPASLQKIVALPDGDKISLEITTPREWKSADPTVVLVHGLCGSHKSPNLVRMAKRLEPMGIKTVRFNMRGCGSGRGWPNRSTIAAEAKTCSNRSKRSRRKPHPPRSSSSDFPWGRISS